ncbi:hypothetical protein [Aliiruegeria haliotis]|nr:hypothetical protein [Aliiruegeria haliotis]
MFASFIFSLLGGFLVSYAEPYVKRLIVDVAKVEFQLDEGDFRVLTFGFLLLLAAIGTALVGGNSSAYLAVAGGMLGYFGADLYTLMRDPDGAMGDDDDDWDGGIEERRSMRDHVEPDADTEETLRAVTEAVAMQPEKTDEERER